MTVKDAHASPFGSIVEGTDFKRLDWGDANTGASADITTAADGCLLIYSWNADANATYLRCKLNDLTAIDKQVSAACNHVIGYKQQQTAGQRPPVTCYSGVSTQGGNNWVIAIRNVSGGALQPDIRPSVTELKWYGSWEVQHDAVTWQAPNPNFTSGTIAGIAVDTNAATIANNNAATAGTSWGNVTGITNTTAAPAWAGATHSFTATDFRNKIIGIQWMRNAASITGGQGAGGVIACFSDGTNWAAFQLVTQAKGFLGNVPEQAMIAIGASSAASTIYAYGSGTTEPDWSAITRVAYLWHKLTATSSALYVNNLTLYSTTAITGGGASRPATWVDYHAALTSWGHYQASVLQGSAQVKAKTSVQIGDGTNATYFDGATNSIGFPQVWSATSNSNWQMDWNVNAGQVTLGVYAKSTDTIKLAAGAATSANNQLLTINGSSDTGAAYDFSQAFGGFNPTWKTGVNAANAIFTGCDTVKFKGASVTNAQIKNTTSTNAACSFDTSSATVTGTTIDLTGTSAGYHIELGTAVTAITLADVTFTGTPGTDKVHVLATTGTVTITISGTTSLVAGDVTSAGATVVIAAPSVDITFAGLVAGMQVKAFTTGTQTELFSTTNSGTSEVWTGASGTFDYTILKDGYLPIRGVGEVISSSRTITVYPAIDRAFITPSGLTFGTNLFYAPATKLAGLTVASTLQNLYSKLIQSFRTEATLQNKPFPMAANGPNSFSWLDGNTFDLTTYPNSITLLSRDGMQYLDTNGAATDVWAAILSVGVPAGMQVRYQQQDGLGTTNAQNTGNIDQLIKIKKTGAGAFDYTNWLVLKVQHAGYDQAEAVAQDIYGTLEDQLYVFGLTPIPNGIAAGATDATVTVTPEPTPVLWNGSYFSTTIKDTTDTHTGLQIMQAVRAENQFNWSDLVRPNGDKFKTVTGNFYGDAYLTPAGVRVVKADGVTPHPDFNLFNDDTGSNPYTPPVTAPITWAGALNGTTVLLYNDSNAGALIDTQSVSGAGGYVWSITLPHADVAVGDSLRLRFGHKEYYAGELQGTMTASGLAFVGAMTLHPIYSAWGLDGSTYDQANGGPFTMDGVNLEIDIGGGAGTGLKKALGAWTQHLMTLPAGLDAFYGAWDLLDLNQIRQNVAIVGVLIDKPSAGQYTFTDNDINYYRSDFSIPYNTTHSPIFMTYNAKPFVATVASSYAITGTAAEIIAAIPSAATIANEVVNVAIVP
jgi:hypothetical protein